MNTAVESPSVRVCRHDLIAELDEAINDAEFFCSVEGIEDVKDEELRDGLLEFFYALPKLLDRAIAELERLAQPRQEGR
jgi:hypothetical protein